MGSIPCEVGGDLPGDEREGVRQNPKRAETGVSARFGVGRADGCLG